MKSQDQKKLWGRSGNVCSFPECGVELAANKQVGRVMGTEAHIKGEKVSASRYDPNQSEEERESYENKILLCPNHHTEIDADPGKWTVECLRKMKADHERQVVNNRRYPELLGAMAALVQQYQPPVDSESVAELEDGAGTRIVRIDASVEDGVNTHIVTKGQTLTFFARGLISYDGRLHFATPEGILCNEYGLPMVVEVDGEKRGPVIFPHPGAYKTIGGELGRIGSLIGWIGPYSADRAFLVGTKRTIMVEEDGCLYLAVNDAKGTYPDNDGEYRVEISVA